MELLLDMLYTLTPVFPCELCLLLLLVCLPARGRRLCFLGSFLCS